MRRPTPLPLPLLLLLLLLLLVLRGSLATRRRSDAASKGADLEWLFQSGLRAQSHGESREAIAWYEALLELNGEHTDALCNLALELSNIAEEGESGPSLLERSEHLYLSALRVDPHHRWAINNLGLLYLKQKRHAEAASVFAAVEYAHAEDSALWYNLGVALQALGNVQGAAAAYQHAVSNDSAHAKARLNLAVLHHQYGDRQHAVSHYVETLNILAKRDAGLDGTTAENLSLSHMTRSNLGLLLYQLGRLDEAEALLVEEQSIFEDDENLIALMRVRMAACNWLDWDTLIARVFTSDSPSILPFDSLLMPWPMTPFHRKAVAERHSSAILEQSDASLGAELQRSHPLDLHRPLNVGYISYDFNDHPTAAMVEGLFFWTKEAGSGCCLHSAYSYGKEDGSDLRQRIISYAHSFVDISTDSFQDAARRIKGDEVDILVDLQGHTLGARPQIVASRPSRIQVSFLIFPGTSGSRFIDFLVTDRFVAPPEDAHLYTEKLVYLPQTYQINFYRSADVGILRDGTRDDHLVPPADGFVFANFNKIDKLEPEVFGVWMGILRRVPGSVLWLLKPSSPLACATVQHNLLAMAEAHGVWPHRLVWADRVSKDVHIARQGLAHLFLDTFLYGAHSTAADALRGGLPVLTLAGDAFASRVGTSLLHNAGPSQNLLVAHSIIEYEELAVELSMNRKFLGRVRSDLLEAAPPLFNTAGWVAKFEAALSSMWEIHVQDVVGHVIVGNEAGVL
jgi:protein O-GlcNAc transferase